MHIVGLDIGGANLKISDGEQRSNSRQFAMWQRVDELTDVLQEMLRGDTPLAAIGVTMTGELADCFSTKAEGVARILSAVSAAVEVPVGVWQTAGEFVSVEVASEFPTLTAAANWHALATWAGRMSPAGDALLFDMGSTTTDIIPLRDGMPNSIGLTDLERLQSSELVYTGMRRTPVCAVVQSVSFRGRTCPVAAELFATMSDVWMILGVMPEDMQRTDTSDGRPATRAAALNRLAHMLCCDTTELSDEELTEVAAGIGAAQRDLLQSRLSDVLGHSSARPSSVMICGEGEQIARQVIQQALDQDNVQIISLTQSLGPEHSQAACAYAVARLARERLR